MPTPKDVERGEYKPLESDDVEEESQALLTGTPSNQHAEAPTGHAYTYSVLHLSIAFVAGIAACILGQLVFTSCCSTSYSQPTDSQLTAAFAPSHVGSTERHNFPPPSPTNAVPSLFPSNLGYAGGTPTGAEAALVATGPVYPVHTGTPNLVPGLLKGRPKGKGKKQEEFNLFRSWGNLSPWYSIEKGGFGVDSTADPPEQCEVTGLHFLHRHGARYPTAWASYGGPAKFASRMHEIAAKWNASGDLDFMNDWTYKLGEEVLTPFGRQQMYDLGISLRIKYGYLLKNFTESNTIPVFRTESQDRMLHSALNFAIGFFGYPFEGKYQQLITIEAPDFNNTLAPYYTCPNARDRAKGDRAIPYVKNWTSIYLEDAFNRLSPQLKGYDLNIEDVYIFQQLCAYETVALGYSKFCDLFTEEEWRGFEYAMDLYFWYDSAFGSPVSRVQGIGYIQELVARLTQTPLETHNSSTNATHHSNPITFPLDQSLYVDATHEVVVLNVITALNLSNFAANGPLPADHIPEDRSFIASELAPFGTNIQFQLLTCSTTSEPQIRVIINDGVVPLTGIEGCPEDKHGMCPLSTFVTAQKKIIKETDWVYDCHGDWQVPGGTHWNTTTGDSPKDR